MVKEFLQDNREYKIFSYEDYKNSSMALKIKKIELLNEYYILMGYSKKLPIFIDFDGVILDTMRESKILLERKHNISLGEIRRDDKERQLLIANFFRSLNWNSLLNETREINESIRFIKLMKESRIYIPTIYSAVNSFYEADEKHKFIERKIGVEHIFNMAHTPKICNYPKSVLIDDDNYNLDNWDGYPIHFDSKISSRYPNIDDLGEIYYLFYPLYGELVLSSTLQDKYQMIKKKIMH